MANVLNKGLSAFCCILVIFFLPACGDRDQWDASLDINSDSLVRLKSLRNPALLNRGYKVFVYESDHVGIGFPRKLEKNSSRKWEYSLAVIPKLISGLRLVMTNQGVAADDYISKYQIILVDKSGIIIGHWRLRMNPANTNEFAMVFPSGGMYKLENFSDFRDEFMPKILD